jgi:hypothetical protein
MPADDAPARWINCLAIMLPLSRLGVTRMSAWPATSETMPLAATAAGEIALSKASGPSTLPPVNLAPVVHLADGRGEERRGQLAGHGFDGREQRHQRRLHADGDGEIDGVLDDVFQALRDRARC